MNYNEIDEDSEEKKDENLIIKSLLYSKSELNYIKV